jgi:hypothetical protein
MMIDARRNCRKNCIRCLALHIRSPQDGLRPRIHQSRSASINTDFVRYQPMRAPQGKRKARPASSQPPGLSGELVITAVTSTRRFSRDRRSLHPSILPIFNCCDLVHLTSLSKRIARMSTSERLFRFPRPEWLNSANIRSAGIYLSGALVS